MRIRNETNINRNWKFTHGDIEQAQAVAFDDTKWSTIGLPHTFELPYWGSDRFYVGYGWYRKNLSIEKSDLEQNIYLEFGAVFQYAEIYLNGTKVGEHKGGYTAFIVDITDFVHAGENKLAVGVNNLWRGDTAPRAGEHLFCGGIYRDVKLITVDKLHVAWYGTFIHTQNESKNHAEVILETEIENNSDLQREFQLKNTLYRADGSWVSSISTDCKMNANSRQTIRQQSGIENPLLWHPDSPNLYKAVTQIIEKDIVTDHYETVFGVRWFEFTSDKGFFINGEHYLIQGANVHQDHAGWGDAVTHAGIYRDVKMIKDCGMNFIRGDVRM